MSTLRIYCLIALSCLVLSCNIEPPQSEETQVAWADTVLEQAKGMMGKSGQASLRFLDSAFLAQNNLSNRALWRKYAAKVNYYEHYEHDFYKRRTYVDSMLLVSASDKETSGYEYAHALYAMATLLQEEKKYNEAFSYYYKGRSFARGKVDNCSIAEFNNALGIIRYRQEHYRQALPYLFQAYKQISQCNNGIFEYDFILHQSILNTIGLSFEKSGGLDSAVVYYNKALAFILSNQGRHPSHEDFIQTARGIVEGNLGGAYALLGDYANAVKHLQVNITINDRPGFAIEHAQIAKINLINLFIKHNELARARALLDEVGKDLQTSRGKSSYHYQIWSRWYAAQASYFQHKGDIPQAFAFTQKHMALRDSLAAEQKSLKDVDVDHLLREEHQRYEFDLLQKGSEIKTISLMAMSAILLLAVVIAVILWRSYIRSKHHVQALTTVNLRTQQALNALEQSERENMQLVKIVAHDLRGPIGAIASLSGMLVDDSDLSEEDAHAMTVIRDTAKNSLDLVNNLMQMHRPDQAALTFEQVDFAALVRQCADMLSVKAREKQQHIHLDLAPVVIPLNYEKMWRVVGNLISNAIKFSPPGGDIHIRLATDAGGVHLYVRDHGIGIPAETGNRIFDSFTSAKRSGTSGEESFGLGLSITKRIVEAHGGEISFESSPGQGTTFHVFLSKK